MLVSVMPIIDVTGDMMMWSHLHIISFWEGQDMIQGISPVMRKGEGK